MLEFSGDDIEIYNGYLKYYNTPFIEDSKIENLNVLNKDGRTQINFDRKIRIDSINLDGAQFDLTRCTYVAVAHGDLDNDIPIQHTDTPKFSDQCFVLATDNKEGQSVVGSEATSMSQTSMQNQIPENTEM